MLSALSTMRSADWVVETMPSLRARGVELPRGRSLHAWAPSCARLDPTVGFRHEEIVDKSGMAVILWASSA